MPTTIDLPNASVSLHDLVRRAVKGDEIIIAEAGTPLVRLVPIPPSSQPQRRRAGLSEGPAIIASPMTSTLLCQIRPGWARNEAAPLHSQLTLVDH